MAAGRLRQAHVALAVLFVVFGTLDGTWAARLPALKHRLGLDSGELGLVIFLRLADGDAAPARRRLARGAPGQPRPTALGLLLAAAGSRARLRPVASPTIVPAACVLGAGFGIVDVAANAHGVALEESLGRPMLSALHGTWSFGLLAGSGIAAGAAAAVDFAAVAVSRRLRRSASRRRARSRRGCCPGRPPTSTRPTSRCRAGRSRCPRS